MQLFVEAGIFSWLGLALFCGGIVDVLRGGARTTTFAAAAAGIALLGAGLGQRMVAAAVERTPSLEDKVRFLAVGTAEATANLVLGGAFVLVLLAFRGAFSLARRGAPPRD